VPTEGRPRHEDLVLRYLAAYGPATVKDAESFSYVKGLRATFDVLRPRLRVFSVGRKQELFDLPDAPRPGGDAPAPVRFIPEYDNLVVARPDERFVAEAHRQRVYLSALRVAPTVLVDGSVAATWALERARKKATLTIQPFAPWPAKIRKAVEAEAEALVAFLEPEATASEVVIGGS
jgi:hypothetical protein